MSRTLITHAVVIAVSTSPSCCCEGAFRDRIRVATGGGKAGAAAGVVTISADATNDANLGDRIITKHLAQDMTSHSAGFEVRHLGCVLSGQLQSVCDLGCALKSLRPLAPPLPARLSCV